MMLWSPNLLNVASTSVEGLTRRLGAGARTLRALWIGRVGGYPGFDRRTQQEWEGKRTALPVAGDIDAAMPPSSNKPATTRSILTPRSSLGDVRRGSMICHEVVRAAQTRLAGKRDLAVREVESKSERE
jgi:hypothetical protein